jgi:hypothetical protein
MAEDPGIIDSIKGKLGGALDGILGFFDRPEDPTLRKISHVALGIIIASIGLTVFYFMNQVDVMHPGFIVMDPAVTSLMGMPYILGFAGLGIAWSIWSLIRDSKHQIAIMKAMAVAVPVGVLAASLSFIGVGFHGGLASGSFSGYTMSGLLMLPTALFAAPFAITSLSRKTGRIYTDTAPNVDEEHPDSWRPPLDRSEFEMVPFHRRATRRDLIT